MSIFWEFVQNNSFVVGALTGSLAAFILGQAVEYIRRERKILKYSKTSRKIAESHDENLEINYKGQRIDNLYSHLVIFYNAGNTALKDISILIECGSGQITEVELNPPPGAQYITTPRDNNNTAIIIECDLINRKESFSIGITSINNETSQLIVVSRAENLSCVEDTLIVNPSFNLLVEALRILSPRLF